MGDICCIAIEKLMPNVRIQSRIQIRQIAYGVAVLRSSLNQERRYHRPPLYRGIAARPRSHQIRL